MDKKENVLCCFLILHYINDEQTIKTVESILSLQEIGNSQIIIVDNGSSNGSGNVLEDKYKGMKQIHIIFSSVNLGFSKGNNLGFEYIKSNFSPEFVIAANNDILFPQRDFIPQIRKLYLEAPFWVAGPDILVPQRVYHSSPLSDKLHDWKEIKSLIEKHEYEQRLAFKKFSLRIFKAYIRDCYADNVLLQKIFCIKRFFQKSEKKYNERAQGVVLQGSCLIFDKRYCQKNDVLFLPLTFMYAEEDILTWNCIRNNWEIRYFPEIQVYHKHEGSSQYSKISYRQYCEKTIVKLSALQAADRIYMEQICKND